MSIESLLARGVEVAGRADIVERLRAVDPVPVSGPTARRAGVVGRCRPVAGARTGAALSIVGRAPGAERAQRACTS